MIITRLKERPEEDLRHWKRYHAESVGALLWGFVPGAYYTAKVAGGYYETPSIFIKLIRTHNN